VSDCCRRGAVVQDVPHEEPSLEEGFPPRENGAAAGRSDRFVHRQHFRRNVLEQSPPLRA
jgi:hypothetical protein